MEVNLNGKEIRNIKDWLTALKFEFIGKHYDSREGDTTIMRNLDEMPKQIEGATLIKELALARMQYKKDIGVYDNDIDIHELLNTVTQKEHRLLPRCYKVPKYLIAMYTTNELEIYLKNNPKYVLYDKEHINKFENLRDDSSLSTLMDHHGECVLYSNCSLIVPNEHFKYKVAVRYHPLYLYLCHAIITQNERAIEMAKSDGTLELFFGSPSESKVINIPMNNQMVLEYLSNNPKYYLENLPGNIPTKVILTRRREYVDICNNLENASFDEIFKLSTYFSVGLKNEIKINKEIEEC